MMGTSFIEERTGAGLFNCGFRSTKDIATKGGYIFRWMMDALMVGIGVGFDTLGAGTCIIKEPSSNSKNLKLPDEIVNTYIKQDQNFLCVVEDSREGWVESVQVLIDSYIFGYAKPQFDYHLIRKAGELIKGFGGVSSGPDPLIELHLTIDQILSESIGNPITSTNIADIGNLLGRCVVAGNVRRSAELIIGQPDDKDFVLLKQDQEKLAAYRWCSNNSIEAKVGMDYSWHAAQSAVNGEPGYIWLDNARTRGRMADAPRDDDLDVMGFNPCVEQQLADGELCCLTETFMARHDSYEDWLRSIKIAYLYAKTVTLVKTHWADTNQQMLSRRRIGLSITGFIQAANQFGFREVYNWSDQGYKYIQQLDKTYSDWLCIPRSRRTTSIKPSGTVSKLFGATPGCHYPEHEYYIQRIRFAEDSDMLSTLSKAGYHIEPCVYSPKTMVVSFPIKEPNFVKSKAEVSMWEQLEIAAQLQHYWADNSVSVTVTFRDHEAQDIARALELYETRLKAVSFLRYKDTGYAQAPMEPITEEQYQLMIKNIVLVQRFDNVEDQADGTKFCDGDTCEIDWSKLATT